MIKRTWFMFSTLVAVYASSVPTFAAPVQEDFGRQFTIRLTTNVDAQESEAATQDKAQEDNKDAAKGDNAQRDKKAEQVHAFIVKGEVDSQLPKYWLGIVLKPIEGDLANYLGSTDGILVDSVLPDSPATAAKLQKGDVLIAVGDEKLTSPRSLLAHMQAITEDDQGKIKALTIKVLRQGEALNLEITPAIRPDNSQVEIATVDENGNAAEFSIKLLEGKSPEEIHQMLAKMQETSRSGFNVFRFGTPAEVWTPKTAQNESEPHKGQLQLKINKSVDGKQLEISVKREHGQPAKITVTTGGETKEYTEKDLDKMPAEVRTTVKELLHSKHIRVEAKSEAAAKSTEPAAEEDAHKQQRTESRIVIVGPEGINMNLGELMNQEVAEKYRAMAQEMAERAQQSAQQSVQWARKAAAMPDEIQELRTQVDALRAEIKELRAQLKATDE